MTPTSRVRPAIRFHFPAFAAVVLGLFTTRPAEAQTWNQPSSGTAANWSAGPWTPVGPAPGPTTVLNFNVLSGQLGYTFTNDVGAFTLNGANFNSWSSNLLTIAIGAANLTLDGTNPFLTNNGPGNVTISGTGSLALNATTTIGGGGNGTLLISSIVSGAGGVTVNQTGLGIFSLTAANTYGGGTTLTNGYLSIGNATALGAGTLTINGGGIRGGGVTIANNVTANADFQFSGGNTLTLNGIISGAGGLRNVGTSILTLQGANTFTGATVVQGYIPVADGTGPILTLSGAAGSLSSTNANAITIGKNATLQLIEAAGAQNANRIPNAAPLRFDGGRFGYIGDTGSTETLGNMTFSGHVRLTATPTGTSTITAGTLTREDNATAIVSWGGSASFGNIANAGTFTTLTFSGGIPVSAVGTGTGTQIGIVPWMVGGTSTTNPRDLVTYDVTNGLQLIPFTNATFITQIATTAGFTAAAVTNQNVHLNGSGTVDLGGGTVVVNSLTTNTDTITFTNGTLKVASGMLVNWDSVAWTSATLDFGAATGYIHVSWGQSFRGTSSITGSGGVVVAGEGNSTNNNTSFENTTGNPFTGGLFVNGNANLGFTADNQLGAAGGNVTLGGGRLAYNLSTNVSVNRPIKLGPSGGGIGFNAVSTTTTSGATPGTANAATTVTLGGIVSGTGAFFKEGVGIVKLGNAGNTYSGGTVVNAGILQFDAEAALGSGKITLGGGSLQPTTALTLTKNIELNASSSFTNNVDVTLGGTLTAVGQLYGTANATLTKNGTGVLTLTASSPLLSGTLAAAAGRLTIGGAATFDQLGTITTSTGGQFRIDNAGTNNANRLNDKARIAMTGGEFYYLGNGGSNSTETFGVLHLVGGANTVTVEPGSGRGAVVTFASYNHAAGSVLFRGPNLGSTSGTFSQIFLTGQAVGFINNSLVDNSPTGNGTAIAYYDAAVGVRAPVSGDYYTNASNLIQNSATINTPTTAHVLVNSGTWATGAAGESNTIASLTIAPAGILTVSNTLTITSGILSQQAGTAGSVTGGTLAFGTTVASVIAAADLTIGSVISGSAGLTKSALGTVTLSGVNTATGALTINGGNLILNNTNAFNGGVNVNGGTLNLNTGSTLPAGNALLVATGATIHLNNAATTSFTTATGGGNVSLGTGANLTITTSGILDGAVSGAGTLTFNPAATGTLALNGNSTTFSGGISVPAANAVAVTLSTTSATGFGTGPLTLNGTNVARTVTVTLPASGTATLTNDFTFTTGTATMSFNAGATTGTEVTLSGKLSGSATTVRFSPAVGSNNVLILTNAANDFTGTIQSFEGYLAATSNGALGNAANVLDLDTTSPGGFRFDAAFDIPRAVSISFDTQTINTKGFSSSISGVISGASNILVNGGGTLTVSNVANTQTGTVTVQAARLLVNGNLAGNATPANLFVNAGGVLGGTGTIGATGATRNVSVASGGSIAPGASPGILTVTGNVTFASGSSFTAELNGATAGNGATNHDRLVVIGDVTLGNATLTGSVGGGFTPNAATRLYVIDNQGTNAVNGTFNGIAQDGTVTLSGGYTAQVSYVGDTGTSALTGGNDVVIYNFVPVPEPVTVLGLAAAGIGAARLLRRKGGQTVA